MRFLIALMLCLALPLQGMAAWSAPGNPCPMEDMVMAADGSATADDMADCCNDALTFMETGQPCKTGMDCGAPVAHVPPAGLLPTEALHPAERFAFLAAAPPPPGRSTIWRPPSHR